MYKKYNKTRKNKFIKNKFMKNKFMKNKFRKNNTINNNTKTKSENKDEHAEVLDAIMVFNYKTDWDQVFNSKDKKQKHLDENIKLLRQSIDKYIQKRSENLDKAMIKSL
jgi:hypothetical protein